jgi:hypothetical protein
MMSTAECSNGVGVDAPRRAELWIRPAHNWARGGRQLVLRLRGAEPARTTGTGTTRRIRAGESGRSTGALLNDRDGTGAMAEGWTVATWLRCWLPPGPASGPARCARTPNTWNGI